MTLSKKAFENIGEKRENASNQHILLFQQCFQTYGSQKSSIYLLYFVVCKFFQSGPVLRSLSFGKE